jgi:hypothetical protein
MMSLLRCQGTGAGSSQSCGNTEVTSHIVCDQLRKSSIGHGRWSSKAPEGHAAYLYDEQLSRPWPDDIYQRGSRCIRDWYLAVTALPVGCALGDAIMLALQCGSCYTKHVGRWTLFAMSPSSSGLELRAHKQARRRWVPKKACFCSSYRDSAHMSRSRGSSLAAVSMQPSREAHQSPSKALAQISGGCAKSRRLH